MAEQKGPGDRDLVLRLIGLFKLLKGVLLVLIGIGAFRLLHRDVGRTVEHWITSLQADPHSHYFHLLLSKLWVVDDRKLKEIGAGSFFYAAVFLTEGTGLLLRKHWAEYFAVIVTGSLVPLEIYELTRGVSALKVFIVIVNVAIVVYLVGRLRHERQGRASTQLNA